MTPDWFAALVSIASLIATIIGWSATYYKQKELENLKGEIQQIVSEHDTRFTYLHKRRGDAIDEIYRQLVKTEKTFNRCLNGIQYLDEPSRVQAEKLMSTTLDELIDCFQDNKIYLPEKFCLDFEHTIAMLSLPNLKVWASNNLNDQPENEMAEMLIGAQSITKEIPSLKKEIEKAIREMLGL